MTTIGILTKPQFPEIKPILQKLVTWLRGRQKDVILGPSTATLIGESITHQDEHLASQSELILVLGGDGTMLRAARLVEERSVPILGVNMGGLGFLTETTVENLYESLEKVFEQNYYLDNRLRLQACICRQDGQVIQVTALNDAVVSKGTLGRMIKIHIQVDKKFLTNLRGDGVIFATPTGSTAYSLSTGGPILDPSLESLMVTPINPHTLTHRPLLVPSHVCLEAKLTSPEGAVATLDGEVGIDMNWGDTIVVTASNHRTSLIRFPDRTYFDVLRTKLKWGDG